jgi:hypothetical protein
MALLGVIVGVMIGGGSFGSAAPSTTAASVVDYSQCANGKPGTTPSNVCNNGWINGILNANNSQYHETEYTAQRLVLELGKDSPTTNRTVTFRYLWNKSVHHAYDALGTWDTTISGLTTATQICSGVPGGANGCPATGKFPTPDDVAGMTNSTCTDGKAPTGQFEIYGADITNVTQAANDSATCSTSADQYETVTITYDVTSVPTRVMILFGGHLAGGTGFWGTGFGAHDINGGPYHIQVTATDGTAIGNRDNQISAGAIQLLTPTLTTQPSITATTSVSLSDTVDVGNSSAVGTADFFLWSDSSCSVAIDSDLNVAVSGGTATSKTFTPTDPTANTTYYFTVHYDGDPTHNLTAADSACTEETASVTIATTGTTP